MHQTGRGKIWRAVRRGLALGLALTVLWCLWWTVDWGSREQNALTQTTERSLTLAMLRRRLGPAPGEAQGLEGWGRRLLRYSPILERGEGQVLKLRKGQDNNWKDHVSQELPDHDDQTKPELQEKQNGNIVETTARGKKGGSYL